ncbi:hypothetical protein Ahy_A02g005092 [Arachis hypogaea]|uniref:Uncharacterized protein n=1 Tax=Arachis hypogaea TaxID=3818 RepID=A0A445E603_ARAHY|nr:hypothetical protein Ahy_A02g005092 [Arachis hypogaea]
MKMLIEKHHWPFKISNVWFSRSKFSTLQYMWSNSVAAEAYASILFLFKGIPDKKTLEEPPTLTIVHSFLVTFFGPLFHYLEKVSHVHVHETIITAWTIRHPTRNSNDPIARAKFYQQSYILPDQVNYMVKMANLILFSKIPNNETLEESPDSYYCHQLPILPHVQSFNILPHVQSFNMHVLVSLFYYLENISHRFRYKKPSLPPRQLDI